MLESLKKALGVKQDQAEPEMSDKSIGLDSINAIAKLAEFAEVIDQLNAVIGEKDASLQELASKLESFEQVAKEAEAQAEAIRVAAEAAALESKKALLAEVVGKDNPSLDALFNSISGLDSEAFNTVVSGFKAARVAEAQSEMFKQVGVSGEAEASTDTESPEMKILKAKRASKQ